MLQSALALAQSKGLVTHALPTSSAPSQAMRTRAAPVSQSASRRSSMAPFGVTVDMLDQANAQIHEVLDLSIDLSIYLFV